jgi:hypothetical protein
MPPWIATSTHLRRFLHFSVVFLFLVSALAKVADFEGSASLVALVLHTDWRASRLFAGGLVLTESALGGWLALKADRAAPLVAALSAMCLFLAASLWLWANGAVDCGCFGSLVVMTPRASAIKDVVFIVIIAALLMSRQHGSVIAMAGVPE